MQRYFFSPKKFEPNVLIKYPGASKEVWNHFRTFATQKFWATKAKKLQFILSQRAKIELIAMIYPLPNFWSSIFIFMLPLLLPESEEYSLKSHVIIITINVQGQIMRVSQGGSLFPSNIALCSHVPTHFRNLFLFYQIRLPPTPSLLTFLHKQN